MSSLPNNFKGIFNNKDQFNKVLEQKMREPTPHEALEMLISLMGANKEWYKNEMFRLIACGISSRIHEHIVQEVESGNQKPFDTGSLAYMMLVNDILQITKEYASDKELEMFHRPSDEETEE